jgi:hypothetical protein
MPYIYLPDNTPSRNYGRNTSSSTFGGSFSNAGSDPRNRGRQRSRQEIEASSRAEYLAKKEHLAKVKGMRDTEKAAEAEKKTSTARAKVLARPDVQAELDRKEEMRLANEARKNKPLERLTPEQSLAKGQAEKQKRDEIAAGPQFSTYADSPQAKEYEKFLYRMGYTPGGGGRLDDISIDDSARGVNALRQAALVPSSMFDDNLRSGLGTKRSYMSDMLKGARRSQRHEKERAAEYAAEQAAKQQASAPAAPATPAAPAAPATPAAQGDDRASVFGAYQSGPSPARMGVYDARPDLPATNNTPEFRKQVEDELMNPSGRARPVAKPAQPVQGLLAEAAAEENMSPQDRQAVQGQRSAYQTAALPYSFPAGLAQYYGGEGGKQLMSDTMDKLAGVPESLSNMFGSEEYKPGPGGQKMLDNAADYLEEKVSPTIDAGVQYARDRIAEFGPGAQRMADQAADYLEPRVDAGVQYAKDRIAEVGPGAQRMADRAADYLEENVSPSIDSATKYGQQKFSDFITAVDRPIDEGGLRFDPGVRMPPQREVGGATGGSIGAPTAPREGINPTSFESLLDSLLPPAYPDSMNSAEASMKANDAWREEMARAEAEANFVGPPAPAPKGKVKVKQRK